MLRIITGKHRGRKLEVIESKTMRPTADRTREAVFNILTHSYTKESGESILEGAVVLDLFCGSGALAFEALSRGAEKAVLIDIEAAHLAVARSNAEHLGEAANVTCLRADSSNPPPAKFPCSLVFLDPPYRSGLALNALKHLKTGGWLQDDSLIIVEVDRREDLFEPADYERLDERIYGNTKIIVLGVK